MRHYLISAVFLVLVVLAAITPVYGSDQMKREILGDLLEADKPSCFEDYSELPIAKTKVRAVVQGMSGAEVTVVTAAWVGIFLEILDDFETMSRMDDEPALHIEALEMADNVNHSIERLAGYDEASSNEIPLLLQLPLEQFYMQEGQFFEKIAKVEKETVVRIEYQSISSVAYRKGNLLTDSSRMKFESARTRRIYEKDMEAAAKFMEEAGLHLYNAKNSPRGFFGLTSGFMEIIKARDTFYSGKNIYEKHSDKKLETVAELASDINATYEGMILEILKVLLGYLALLALLALIVYRRIVKWREDLYDTRLGEELIF